jgi:acetyltransferase-like isoleucine patch superfamily enzyme
MNYYCLNFLKSMGIKIYGKNIKISKLTQIYNPKNVILHDNIRIDDFTILSGNGIIEICNFVHIGSHCTISSSANVKLSDFSGISTGVKIFGSSDDYSGKYLTNPTVPDKYKSVSKGNVILEKHVLIGSNSVILPNIILKEGTSVGAISLVNKSTEKWNIYAGIPIKLIKKRNSDCLEFEKQIYNQFMIDI